MKSARARRVPRHAPRLALALAFPFSSALAQSAAPTLPAVTVTANSAQDQDLPAPYAGGQVAQGARLGMMGNQDVMDTPFNVTSYTAELIQNQQARTLADVMANDASVRFTTSSGHAYENFRIRGFDVNQNDVAINGMYGLAPMGRTPLEFVERVEVLKGPNALFSGMAPSGAVGGTINLVPKRADDTPNATFGVNWQGDGQLGTTIDAGRRFGDANQWGARVNGAFSDGATTLDGQSRKREFLSLGLDYRGSALSASIDAYHSQESFQGGTPAMFWFGGSVVPKAPDPRINQFSTGYGSIQSNAVVGRAEYRFNDNVSVFGGIGRRDSHQSGLINGTHARQIDANGNFTGSIIGQRAYTDATSAEAGLRSRFKTGAVGHELVLQASILDTEDGSATGTASTFRSNIYDPITPVMPGVPDSAPKTAENTLTSLALVDTMSFLDDRLRLTGGLRNQRVKTTNFDKNGNTTSRYDKQAVTPAVALVVKPWGPDLSFYANYVQGLSKGDSVTDTTATNFGQVFAPYKTEQKEVGVKWNAGTFTNTLALFQIDKPMLVTEGTTARPTYADGGEKRVRGVEWNTFGELARGVRVLGGVTYSQGKQTKTSFGRYDGNTAVGAPRWQANTGLEWDTPWIAGLTLSARVQATSSQYADAANKLKIPGWGQLDLGARYAMLVNGKDVVLRLNVNNVFDKHYYAGSFSDTTPIATLGPARTVTASASISF
ncbi:Ferrichrome receptor FcuA precursor [Achromobacter xylosoxidans]|uniref:TonB-dependent receptor n=2 Tax=Alcaligenaceae TaxID=506 RepID=UPI0006C2B024|nr:TonB-dependent receptor [Achromobacter xylosoxidans]CUI98855.1 Ferrichrome receptor FcuA precursor [Achromobacter xylosoxidans]CUJ26473.1 Ferrichrome receptor FcuA precursor [Achromobacter xylosoxidans]CUJ31716.1 Ferrichrome receptor FcuA precursor [Achromobacter xylosoxidans]CUJ42871.1 Ferrichrome receptor FcuA precursor [Achromobacter xylosoxidans]